MNGPQDQPSTEGQGLQRKDSGVESKPHVDLKNFGNPIDNKRPATREEWQEAVDFLKTKLDKVSKLKALVEIDLTGDNPHVFVDSRGDTPSISETCPEEGVPHVVMRMRPLTMLHLGQGLMDTRYATFFSQMQLTGDARLGVKFADLISPVQPISPPDFNTYPRLPEPTTDFEQVKRDLKEFGYGLVKDALKPDQLAALQQRLKDQADGEKAAGVAFFDGGPTKPNQRVWNLPNKGQEFIDLLDHPLVEEFIPDFLGDGYHLSSYSANINRPGAQAMGIHTDQITINPAIPQYPLGLNLMWFLCEVTEANGGTRILPKSHNGLVAPDNIFDIAGTTFASGPPGTCLVFESRLWHATGAFTGTEGERPVILQFYVRHFVRPQENFTLSVAKEVEPMLSDAAKQAMGFRVTATLGGIEGFKPDGMLVSRPENPVVALKPDGSPLW